MFWLKRRKMQKFTFFALLLIKHSIPKIGAKKFWASASVIAAILLNLLLILRYKATHGKKVAEGDNGTKISHAMNYQSVPVNNCALLKIEQSKLACLVYIYAYWDFWYSSLHHGVWKSQKKSHLTFTFWVLLVMMIFRLVTKVHHFFFKITYYYIALLFEKCVIITLILQSRVSLLWKSWYSSDFFLKGSIRF